MAAGTTLADLPVELIDLIAEWCENEDFRSVRYASASLFHKTDSWYGRTHLRTLNFDFTPRAFQRIEHISSHPLLRNYPTKLVLYPHDNELGEGLVWNRDEKGLLIEPLPSPVSSLGAILGSLKNCTSFDFHPRTERPPYRPKWIHGLEALQLIVNNIPEESAFPQRIVVTVWDVTTRNTKYSWLPNCDPALMPWRPKSTDLNPKVWTNLVDLFCETNMLGWAAELILTILNSASNLKTLCMDFSNEERGPSRINEYLGCDHFPQLCTLHLIDVDITGRMLQKMLVRVGPTLHTLMLVQAGMECGEPWASVIYSLRNTTVRLKRLRLCSLTDRQGMVWFRALDRNMAAAGLTMKDIRECEDSGEGMVVSEYIRVYVVDEKVPGRPVWVRGFQCQGPQMKAFLCEMEQTIDHKPVWPDNGKVEDNDVWWGLVAYEGGW